MSSSARFVWRSLTALLLSIAIAWAPTAFSVPYALIAGNSITLGPSQGPPGASVHVEFPNCTNESHLKRPGRVNQVTWDGYPVSDSADFTVPDKAPTGAHPVQAQCDIGAVGPGSATFTVTSSGHGENGGTTPEYDPELTLDPTEGASGTTVTATGSGFNCSSVEVVWDARGARATLTGADVLSEGTFAARFAVPADSAKTTYTVRAECAQEPYASDDADFTVTGTPTDGTETGGGNGGNGGNGGGNTGETTDGTTGDTTGGTSGGTTGGTTGDTTGGTDGGTTGDTTGGTTGGTDGGTGGGTDGGTTDGTSGGTGGGDTGGTGGTHGGGTTPVGLVIGPSALAAVLLLAGLFALANHRHRGPRWVRDHVRTTLRPGAGRADLYEHRDARSPDRTVRLEPHTDPGEQRLH